MFRSFSRPCILALPIFWEGSWNKSLDGTWQRNAHHPVQESHREDNKGRRHDIEVAFKPDLSLQSAFIFEICDRYRKVAVGLFWRKNWIHEWYNSGLVAHFEDSE